MDLISTDVYGRETGYVLNANVDFEIGEDSKDSINDFEVEYKRDIWTGDITHGCRMFSPDTEFGGIVKEITTDTKADTIKVKGYTWRGMMMKKIISPLDGQDYATASGELNSIIKEKIESEFPGLFVGVTEDTGVSVTGYQFDRYCSLHDGFVKMLKSVGYRMDIRYKQGDSDEVGWVQVKAVPITDYSQEQEFSNDNDMYFTMDENFRGINHLICLGKGELKERIVEHLYVDANGNVGTNQFYRGIDEIAEVYDSSGSERDDLIDNGTKKIEESKNRTEYTMTMEKIEGNMDIGDIVGGRDYLLGVNITKPIGRKIWTISEGEEKVEYKLEGES